MDDNQDIVDFYHTLIDDQPDDVTTLVLLNQSDAIIRRLRLWEILKKLDSSQTRIQGEGFSTTKSLPTDFDRPNKIYVGTQQRPPLKRVRFEEQQIYLNSPGVYMLDYKNKTLAVSNGTWDGTIYNHYLYKPARLILGDTPNFPVFDNDFWPLWAYMMAAIQQGGIDFDAISSQSAFEWNKQAKVIWDAMISWDADLKDEGNILRFEGDSFLPPIDLGLL